MLRRRRIRNWLAHLGPWIFTPHAHQWALLTDEHIRQLLDQDRRTSDER